MKGEEEGEEEVVGDDDEALAQRLGPDGPLHGVEERPVVEQREREGDEEPEEEDGEDGAHDGPIGEVEGMTKRIRAKSSTKQPVEQRMAPADPDAAHKAVPTGTLIAPMPTSGGRCPR